MDTLGIALSGMQSAERRIATSAHNVANLLTEDFRPLRATQQSLEGGGSETRVRRARGVESPGLEREVVEQITAATQYDAAARVFSVQADTTGTLIDLLA